MSGEDSLPDFQVAAFSSHTHRTERERERERDDPSKASSQIVFLCRRDLIMTTLMILPSQRSEIPGQ